MKSWSNARNVLSLTSKDVCFPHRKNLKLSSSHCWTYTRSCCNISEHEQEKHKRRSKKLLRYSHDPKLEAFVNIQARVEIRWFFSSLWWLKWNHLLRRVKLPAVQHSIKQETEFNAKKKDEKCHWISRSQWTEAGSGSSNFEWEIASGNRFINSWVSHFAKRKSLIFPIFPHFYERWANCTWTWQRFFFSIVNWVQLSNCDLISCFSTQNVPRRRIN